MLLEDTYNATLFTKTLHDMDACFQFEDQNVYEHGKSVADFATRLLSDSFDLLLLDDMRLPEWFIANRSSLLEKIYPLREDFVTYCIMHDCGKPYCRTEDGDGKVHFSNHEQVSFERWVEISGDPNGLIAQCILHDMDMHRFKGNQVDELVAFPFIECLLVSSLAEIHANAQMFGGIDTDGFKIKYAQIERRGKQVCKKLYANG